MPYVAGRRYDLFLSYAHIDNEPGPDNRGWVTDFHNCLVRTIRQKLGQDAEVFFDPALRSNQQLPELLAAAGGSAILLVVGSPSWTEREFCQQELTAFAGDGFDASRIFIAEYMALGEDQTYPSQIDQHLRLEFHTSRGSTGDVRVPLYGTNESDKALYLERIHRLAGDIVDKLRSLRKADAAPKPSAAAKGAEVGVTVLIAEPTDDLEDSAAGLGAYLEQYGIRPLFAPKNYIGGEEFAQQFAAMLGQADMFVQLLGPYGGKRPPELPQGFTAFQAEGGLASGKPVLQWRRPDLELDKVPETHRPLLEGKDVVSSTFEDFKARVKDLALSLAAKPEPAAKKRPATSSSIVFIDADPADLDAAHKIGKEFQDQGLFCLLPSNSDAAAERMEELEENLIDCDVLVCLYGSTQSRWVHAQLKLLAKVNPKRSADLRVLAVCSGPPRPKEPLRALFPGLREIDCGGDDGAPDWNIQPIRELIVELNQ